MKVAVVNPALAAALAASSTLRGEAAPPSPAPEAAPPTAPADALKVEGLVQTWYGAGNAGFPGGGVASRNLFLACLQAAW